MLPGPVVYEVVPNEVKGIMVLLLPFTKKSPILMTSLAFILGLIPLVLSSGPGSASRQAIGTGVFFGMIFAVVFGVILVPFFFVVVYKIKNRFKRIKS